MPATRKTRWLVRVESGDGTGDPSNYGLFNDLDRASKFADRVRARIDKVRSAIDQSRDYWHVTVEAVTAPLMREVEKDGWTEPSE